ncbi:MAG: hypothetical protein ACKOC5_07410 [Chloroflexota bacterium]
MDTKTFQQLQVEVDAIEAISGVDMNELLNISEELRALLVWMIRRNGFTLEDLAEYMSCETSMAQALLERLARKLLVEEMQDTQTFIVHVASSRTGRKYRVSDDVWKVFD